MAQDKILSKRNLIGYAGCLGGLLIHLIIGSIYQWGIINIYIASYFKTIDPTVTLQTTAIGFPILMFFGSLSLAPGLVLAQKTDPLVTIGASVILQAVFVFASSYTRSIWAFMAIFGVLFGFVSSANYMVPILECNKYFPNKKMYINGFILVGTGISPLIFGMFTYNFVNPLKIHHNYGYYYGSAQLQEIAQRVPQCIRWLSLIYLIFGVLAFLLMFRMCRQNKLRQNQVNNRKEIEASQQQRPNQSIQNTSSILQIKIAQQVARKANSQYQGQPCDDINKPSYPNNLKQAMLSKIFWIGGIIFLLGTCGTLLINVSYKTYVKLIIFDDQFLTLIGVVSGIVNGISRLLWNILFNHTGYKLIAIVCLSLQIMVFISIRFTVYVRVLYLIMVTLSGCCFAGFVAFTPAFCQIVYGPIVGSKVFSMYAIILGLSNFLQFGLVLGLAPLITLNGVIYIVLAMSIISFFIIILYRFEAPWHNPMQHLQYCIKLNQQSQQ